MDIGFTNLIRIDPFMQGIKNSHQPQDTITKIVNEVKKIAQDTDSASLEVALFNKIPVWKKDFSLDSAFYENLQQILAKVFPDSFVNKTIENEKKSEIKEEFASMMIASAPENIRQAITARLASSVITNGPGKTTIEAIGLFSNLLLISKTWLELKLSYETSLDVYIAEGQLYQEQKQASANNRIGAATAAQISIHNLVHSQWKKECESKSSIQSSSSIVSPGPVPGQPLPNSADSGQPAQNLAADDVLQQRFPPGDVIQQRFQPSDQ